MKLPPLNEYGPLADPPRYFFYSWDTKGTPEFAYEKGMTIFTPAFSGLRIWGREVTSPYEEDLDGLERLKARGRVMGEWFSVNCPEGELGSHALDECIVITEAAFAAAYAAGWKA